MNFVVCECLALGYFFAGLAVVMGLMDVVVVGEAITGSRGRLSCAGCREMAGARWCGGCGRLECLRCMQLPCIVCGREILDT